MKCCVIVFFTTHWVTYVPVVLRTIEAISRYLNSHKHSNRYPETKIWAYIFYSLKTVIGLCISRTGHVQFCTHLEFKCNYWLITSNRVKNVGFEVFTAVVMKSTSIMFWDMTPWRIILLLTCLLAGLLAGFLLNLFLRPWRCRRYIPPKRRLTLKGLHGIISQEMILSVLKNVYNFIRSSSQYIRWIIINYCYTIQNWLMWCTKAPY
jgi:hypothetical protein